MISIDMNDMNDDMLSGSIQIVFSFAKEAYIVLRIPNFDYINISNNKTAVISNSRVDV